MPLDIDTPRFVVRLATGGFLGPGGVVVKTRNCARRFHRERSAQLAASALRIGGIQANVEPLTGRSST